MKRIATLMMLLMLSIAACGDDAATTPDAGGLAFDASAGPDATSGPDAAGDPDATTGGGSATITGTLAEQNVTPASAFLIEHPQILRDVLVMPESGVSCVVGAQPGLTAVIGFLCGDPAVGTMPVRDPDLVDCQDETHVFFLVEGFQGEFNEYVAADGMVTIDTLTADEITGSFSADFGDKGALSGTFSADVCD